MAVTIKSLRTSGPVWVPLTTGGRVRLSPGQISAELPDVALSGNTGADKLRDLGVIDIEPVPEKEEKDPARSRKRPESSE